jgi:uncharacterized membrane protein
MSKEKPGSEHLKEGKKHLEKGTQKVLREGIEKGRRKTDYYRENRSELIQKMTNRFGDTKKPAVSGIIVLLPVLVVLFVVDWLFDKIQYIPGNQYFNLTDFYVVNQTYKLAILLVIGAIIVTGVGRLVRTKRGFQLEKLLDSLFDKIPFLGSIYDLTKVSAETLLGGGDDFSRPVKIEFNGMRVTGFKTGKEADDGRDIVFIPTAPNITSGMVVEIDEDRVTDADETSEEALTRILSAGFGQRDGKDTGRKEDED